jgi:hypothetical protein
MTGNTVLFKTFSVPFQYAGTGDVKVCLENGTLPRQNSTGRTESPEYFQAYN